MKVKTDLKAGLEMADVQRFAQGAMIGAREVVKGVGQSRAPVVKGAGQRLAPLAEGAKQTITSPGFWTWPF
jgi:hypothetical protein